MTSPDTPSDLVVISLAGGQRFTTESRTTADLSAASAIVARLSTEATKACAPAPGARVVSPVDWIKDGQDAPVDAHHVPATPNRGVRVPRRASDARRGQLRAGCPLMAGGEGPRRMSGAAIRWVG